MRAVAQAILLTRLPRRPRRVAVALAVAATCPNVLCDVSHGSFVDTAVINEMLGASRLARQREGALEVVVPEGSPARRAMDLAGVQMILPFHETRGAGLASVEAAAQLRTHRAGRRDLRTVTARIVDLQARTESSRAREAALNAGIIVLRAHVSETDRAEDHAHRRAA
jgi:hypothetical protein